MVARELRHAFMQLQKNAATTSGEDATHCSVTELNSEQEGGGKNEITAVPMLMESVHNTLGVSD